MFKGMREGERGEKRKRIKENKHENKMIHI